MASHVATALRTAVRSEKVRDDQNPDLLEWRREFISDATTPLAIGATVADTVQEWGIARKAGQARSLAVVQTAWLLANGHIGDSVSLYLKFQVVRRELTITVGDGGTVVLAPLPSDRLRSFRRGWLYTNARTRPGGREIVCVIKVRPDWTIRLTWQRDALGALHHPLYSFEPCDTRQQALAKARCLIRTIGSAEGTTALLAVHVQGPEQAEIDECEMASASEQEGATAEAAARTDVPDKDGTGAIA